VIFRDQFSFAFGNLRKTRLRTILTAAGVMIGIGAMTSMVSVGVGTQRKVMQAFGEENLLTAIVVRPGSAPETQTEPPPALDADAIEEIRRLDGVRDAYPILNIPGMLRLGGEEYFQTLEGMPARFLNEQIELNRIDLLAGRPYKPGEREVIMLSRRAASRFLPEGAELDTLLGQKVSFVVARAPGGGDTEELEAGRRITPGELGLPPVLESLPISDMLQQLSFGLFEAVELDLEVIGIIEGAGSLTDFLGVSLWVPIELVEPLYARSFRNLETILTGDIRGDEYAMVQVLTEDIIAVSAVQEGLREMGFRGESILDQIAEIRRAFVLMNGFLAMIGGISLLVAAMMIVNTLVMAVMERTREIGLLKALGASNRDVMRLFLTEAGVIGLLGGVGGIVLGKVVAEITNALANFQFERVGEVSVDLVAFPFWLIAGGIAFAMMVSFAAGYYPSRRAARVDPVVALRHF